MAANGRGDGTWLRKENQLIYRLLRPVNNTNGCFCVQTSNFTQPNLALPDFNYTMFKSRVATLMSEPCFKSEVYTERIYGSVLFT